jgi:hypothetical protein
MGYLARIPAVFSLVLRSNELRRAELAFAGFNCAEWAVWIAMLVYAYTQGGATEAGIAAFVQLVPAAALAPFLARLSDRRSPARVLAGGYAGQAVAAAVIAAALFGGAPAPLVYALAAVGATLVTVTRPAQAVLVPGLARAADELTATNVVSGWIESASVLVAPAATGVLLAVGSPGVVFAAAAVVLVLAALAIAPIRVAPPMDEVAPDPADRASAAPAPRLLLALLGGQYVLIGALDVLFVVLALGVLGLGGSGAGYLNAAFGAGGTLGIAVTVALVGRKRLSPPLALGGAVFSLAFIVLGLRPTTAGAFLLIAVAGGGRALFDVAGRTLLQRTVPSDVLGSAFGLLESLSMAGLAVGSLLVPALVALGGARAACIGLGSLLPAVALLAGRRLLALDQNATVPIVEIALLRSLPLFAPLGAPTLESLARSLETVETVAGQVVIRQGEGGDRFYAIADGAFDVSRRGEPVATLTRGDGFGEIALLLDDTPRTADVVSAGPGRLYALGKDDFVEAVTGNPLAAAEGMRIVRERLPAEATSA